MTDSTSLAPLAMPADGGLYTAMGAIALLVLVGLYLDVRLIASWRERPGAWRQRLDDARGSAWSLGGTLAVGAVFVASQAVLLVLAQSGLLVPWTDVGEITLPALLLQTLWPSATVLAMIALVGLRQTRASIDGPDGRRPSQRPMDAVSILCHGLLGYAAALPPFIAGSVLWRLVMDSAGIAPDPQAIVGLLLRGDAPPWVVGHFVVLAVSIAPLVEEFMFRRLLLPAFLLRHGAAFSVAVVSVLFAAVHFHLPSLLPLFTIGAALALAYLWTGSVAVTVVMHAVFNGVNLLCLALFGTT